jgi:uncharacterized protein (DUF362 family)
LVIASTDALAADVVGARLLGFKIDAVRHLWEAARRGVGTASLSSMHFPALELEEAIRRFTSSAYGEARSYEHA